MHQDLEGLTVVSVEQAVVAPYLTCRLADAGARVIKVEHPEGDFARGYDALVAGQASYFVWLNRGKQSRLPRPAGGRASRRAGAHGGRGPTSSCRTSRRARSTGSDSRPGGCGATTRA